MGFVVLVPPLVAIYTLHAVDPQRPWLLLFGMVLVWVADSAAYFAGHFFGRTKLAPAISPGKTVEGVIGGLVAVALLAWLGNTFVWRYVGEQFFWWLALAGVAAIFSVAGDLLESKFKRAAGVKDSGNLLPGHGGVLDRIDATTAALPVFALGWLLLFTNL
jgi:phosphatidate cytidylyltransferase